MTEITNRHENFETLRERAVALRREGLSLRQIARQLGVRDKETLSRLVQGEPPPEWTKRPRAKDDVRRRARELRSQGWTYSEIQTELSCSKSSVSLWVRDLPAPEPRRTPEERRARMNAGLAELRAAQEREREAQKEAATRAVGRLSERELFLAGVALYWAEGTKSKTYRRSEALQFINSDPDVIRFHLRWLASLGVTKDRLTLRLSIHESADVPAAETFWADVAGVETTALRRATLKKHNPRTVRKNTGEAYHGCLIVYVRQSADLYRRVEGAWYGIVLGATRQTD